MPLAENPVVSTSSNFPDYARLPASLHGNNSMATVFGVINFAPGQPFRLWGIK